MKVGPGGVRYNHPSDDGTNSFVGRTAVVALFSRTRRDALYIYTEAPCRQDKTDTEATGDTWYTGLITSRSGREKAEIDAGFCALLFALTLTELGLSLTTASEIIRTFLLRQLCCVCVCVCVCLAQPRGISAVADEGEEEVGITPAWGRREPSQHPEVEPVHINVDGHFACLLLDDDTPAYPCKVGAVVLCFRMDGHLAILCLLMHPCRKISLFPGGGRCK